MQCQWCAALAVLFRYWVEYASLWSLLVFPVCCQMGWSCSEVIINCWMDWLIGLKDILTHTWIDVYARCCVTHMDWCVCKISTTHVDWCVCKISATHMDWCVCKISTTHMDWYVCKISTTHMDWCVCKISTTHMDCCVCKISTTHMDWCVCKMFYHTHGLMYVQDVAPHPWIDVFARCAPHMDCWPLCYVWAGCSNAKSSAG